MTIRQALRIALAAGAFAGFGLGGALLSWIALPIVSCDRDRERRQRRCRRLVQATFVVFHDYMRLCGLVAYDPRRAPRTLPDGPFVLVTNHPTLVDVTALIAAYGQLCVVAKGSLFRNPLIGPLLRLCGYIDGGQSGFGTPAHVVDQVIERLRQGQGVLMFPEGTRSPESGLHRFRAGAFNAAFAARVPVVPAAIASHPPGLKKGQAWYAIPTTAIAWTVDPLEPLAASAYQDARDLLVDARARIERALARHAGDALPASTSAAP
jgi:1-acyl-sn-glycerol-3-phosphate acyltransferase